MGSDDLAHHISVTLGMAMGYLAGRPVHRLASLDGMLAGFMGGLMGPMLGVMVAPESPLLMIGFLDIVSVGMAMVLISWIRELSTTSISYSQGTDDENRV
ncbi:hypothetical protein GCM10011571_11800 [Marinithermofilum abyssi]|uniref:Uncharacterized protein n=1 Tax=Marinithermofilum abyssi TaxID=1571185 RepID=A0A8J2VDJ2_9BACL|nr:hypothetical protein GCM10011571_11800 [Marinithermofilum abyssi]